VVSGVATLRRLARGAAPARVELARVSAPVGTFRRAHRAADRTRRDVPRWAVVRRRHRRRTETAHRRLAEAAQTLPQATRQLAFSQLSPGTHQRQTPALHHGIFRTRVRQTGATARPADRVA